MTYFFIAILIILIVILVYLYAINRISGQTLAIIILIVVILLMLIPSLIGFGVLGFSQKACMNNNCTVVKLPLDITKVKKVGDTNYLYKIGMVKD